MQPNRDCIAATSRLLIQPTRLIPVGGVDNKGYKECRFDLTISGTDFTSLEVQALFWNVRQEKWMGGGKRVFTATGQHSLVVDCRGAIIFLKVTAFSGTSFSLSADYVLS